jgi:inhibitor of KinA
MRIFPLGDNALTVEFGNEISVELNRKAIALGELISSEPFPGFIEVVPSYSSVTVFYDSQAVRQSITSSATAFEYSKSNCRTVT